MPIVRRFWVLLFLGVSLFSQTVQVGDGSPTSTVKQTFVNAWMSNGFNLLVADPTTKVTTFGTTGLIQVFPSATSSTVQLALVKPDTTESQNVRQVLAPMYAYYSTIGVNNAGFPVFDTGNCPAISNLPGGPTCQLQYFDKNYALFIYTPALNGVTNIATRDPFYSKWSTLGGIQGLGPATTPETHPTRASRR